MSESVVLFLPLLFPFHWPSISSYLWSLNWQKSMGEIDIGNFSSFPRFLRVIDTFAFPAQSLFPSPNLISLSTSLPHPPFSFSLLLSVSGAYFSSKGTDILKSLFNRVHHPKTKMIKEGFSSIQFGSNLQSSLILGFNFHTFCSVWRSGRGSGVLGITGKWKCPLRRYARICRLFPFKRQ